MVDTSIESAGENGWVGRMVGAGQEDRVRGVEGWKGCW